MAKTNAYWGIDIGQCALKALRCTPDADGQTIVADKYDYIEYPKILSQADADPEELVREALEQFLSRNEMKGDSVAISVPGQAGLSRFFKPPPVDARTLPDIVKYEVKQQIPFPIEDVIWDWQQLGGTIVDGRTVDAEIGLFAMKRDAVFRALRPFDEADVEVDLIQLSPLSIFNVVCSDILDEIPDAEDLDPESPPESLVVMSMGTDTTDLIVSNGVKLWLRNIPIGGNHFTKILSRELKLTHAKAEHLKRNARQAEDPKTVFRAMRPVFTDLVNEVQRSLAFFQSMDKSADISKIVLLGNAAKLPGLRQFLNKQLEIDIAKVSDFENLSGSDVISQKSFSDNLLAFAPCYGLCLQGLKRGKINTNLLPVEIRTERIIRAKKPWVLASVGLIMLGLLLGYFFNQVAWWRVHEDYSQEGKSWKQASGEVDTQKNSSTTKVNQDNELKAKLVQLNALAKELTASYENRGRWIEITSALHQAMPKDPRIKGNSVDPTEIPFADREEVFVDSIDAKYFTEIGDWVKGAQTFYDAVYGDGTKKKAEGGAAANAKKPTGRGATRAGTTKAGGASAAKPKGKLAGPGWVIELKAHHFRNSEDMVRQRDATRAFVIRSILNKLNDMTDDYVVLPGKDEDGGGKFKFQDLGIHHPILISGGDSYQVAISYTPTGGNAAVEEGSDSNEAEVENVERFDFTVQMAWLPKTPKERIEARTKRIEAETKAAEEAAKKAEQEKNNNS